MGAPNMNGPLHLVLGVHQKPPASLNLLAAIPNKDWVKKNVAPRKVASIDK